MLVDKFVNQANRLQREQVQLRRYSEDEARDERGRWSGGNGGAAKAPYEMTQQEYHSWRSSNGHTNRSENNSIHHNLVEGALSGRRGAIVRDEQGNPVRNPSYRGGGTGEPYLRHADVPPHVLAEYPDLKQKVDGGKQ